MEESMMASYQCHTRWMGKSVMYFQPGFVNQRLLLRFFSIFIEYAKVLMLDRGQEYI